jgi:excisionase family DNA binding protein
MANRNTARSASAASAVLLVKHRAKTRPRKTGRTRSKSAKRRADQPCKAAFSKGLPKMAKHNPPVEAVNSTILTKQEAANFIRCTTRYLERQVKSGRLRAYKPTGKLWRVRRADLEAFLESGATIGGDA